MAPRKAPVAKATAKPKVDLAKEAKVSKPKEHDDVRITDAIILDKLPKDYVAAFKKAKTTAARADLLYTMDRARLELGKQVTALEEAESKLKQWFIQELPEKDGTGISGKMAHIQIKRKERPNVTDWTAFYAHIGKTKSFDLLNKMVNTKAVGERWEANKQIPGLEKFAYSSVSITKVK